MKQKLAEQGSTLKHVLVTTRADNFAQKLSQSTLGAEVETTISNLYSVDEVLMIARNVGERIAEFFELIIIISKCSIRGF